MEQLLHLERLKGTILAGVDVYAVSPDTPEKTRELVSKLAESKKVRLTPRFFSDSDLAATSACGARNTKGAMTVRPVTILFDADGREAWRFTEKHARMTPTDEELEEAVKSVRKN